jgi:hypothetical protein
MAFRSDFKPVSKGPGSRKKTSSLQANPSQAQKIHELKEAISLFRAAVYFILIFKKIPLSF